MSTITDTDRRLLYAAICTESLSPTEIGYDLTTLKKHVVEMLSAAIAEGWVIESQRGNAVKYRAISKPACCHGGFIPPNAEQLMCATLRAKHAKSTGTRAARRSRAKSKNVAA